MKYEQGFVVCCFAVVIYPGSAKSCERFTQISFQTCFTGSGSSASEITLTSMDEIGRGPFYQQRLTGSRRDE